MNIRLTSFVALAVAVALTGCGRGSRGDNPLAGPDRQDTSAAQPAGTTGASPFGAPAGRVARGPAIGKIRVINTIAVNGAPGPAMDVYDISRPDESTRPLIANLQYGQVSEYVTPHGWVPGDTHSNLYVLPAGSKTPTDRLPGGNIDNSGFEAGDQLTLALFGSDLNFGIKQFAEAGKRIHPWLGMDPTPPAGQGLLLLHEAVSRVSNEPEPVMYLSIDGACPKKDNGVEGRYPIAAGDHTLGLVTSPPGMGLTQEMCTEKTPVASVHTHVDAGRDVDVVIYGPTAALKLLAAPVEK